ncbi:MAG TPA: DUF2490 domain-containing protein [Chitinophagaceae bacterium]|nr:DUF2490 domain-containing protein [Chitinophagaceae bacterium]
MTERIIMRMHFCLRVLFVGSCCFLNYSLVRGQEQTTYSQFWNEFSFTKTLKGKWSLELNLGQTWTSSPDHNSMFSFNSQLYARAWVHYHFNARWKFSFFYAYYFNKYVPEIKQKGLPEFRSAYQATYYIHKIRHTLSARLRIEDRHIRNDSGTYEAYYRFRTQIKLLYPINGKRIREGVFYGIGSEEFYFKTTTTLTGKEFFDRSRLTLGMGYSLTNDIQAELTYVNEFLPRDSGDEIYNVVQLNFAFNNFLANLKNKFLPKKDVTQLSD